MNCSSCGTKIPDDAAFCVSCGVARPADVASKDSANFCPSCGTKTEDGVAFCTSCGAAITGAAVVGASTAAATTQIPVATPPSTLSTPPVTPPPGPPPAPTGTEGSGVKWGIVGIAGALAAIVLVLVILLVTKDSGKSDTTSPKESTTTTTVAPTTTIPATTTTLDPVTAARTAKPQLYDLATRMESVLTQSSAGRGQVGQVVGDVRNCRVTPNTAAIEIDQVVSNRQSVLNQLSSLNNSAGAEGTALISALQTAIRESITADQYYSAWMKYLYANYYYTRPIGCPSGSAPLNGDYSTAQAASGRASTAKQDFVNIFNPIAESFGLQAWDPGEI